LINLFAASSGFPREMGPDCCGNRPKRRGLEKFEISAPVLQNAERNQARCDFCNGNNSEFNKQSGRNDAMLLLTQTPSTERLLLDENIEELDWEMEEADGQPYLPTPWEIQRCCREIRRGWSESEYRKRAGYSVRPLEIAATPCRVSMHEAGHLDFS
jgi:hypothetical protein